MARRIRDVRHADFRGFTKALQSYKRQLRELRPETEPQQTLVIHDETERRVVMDYLLARYDDEKAGGTEHVTAFRKDRECMKVFRRIVARIPAPAGRVMNE